MRERDPLDETAGGAPKDAIRRMTANSRQLSQKLEHAATSFARRWLAVGRLFALAVRHIRTPDGSHRVAIPESIVDHEVRCCPSSGILAPSVRYPTGPPRAGRGLRRRGPCRSPARRKDPARWMGPCGVRGFQMPSPPQEARECPNGVRWERSHARPRPVDILWMAGNPGRRAARRARAARARGVGPAFPNQGRFAPSRSAARPGGAAASASRAPDAPPRPL